MIGVETKLIIIIIIMLGMILGLLLGHVFR